MQSTSGVPVAVLSVGSGSWAVYSTNSLRGVAIHAAPIDHLGQSLSLVDGGFRICGDSQKEASANPGKREYRTYNERSCTYWNKD